MNINTFVIQKKDLLRALKKLFLKMQKNTQHFKAHNSNMSYDIKIKINRPRFIS